MSSGVREHFEGVKELPIEAFWHQYREGGIQYWIEHFKGLERDGKWNANNIIHELSLLYVYMPILEEELVNIKEDWNGHKIRLQKRTDRPNGIPNELFDFPELKGIFLYS
ncbi:hypothetical protein AC249_AIPGENE7742 [Exaiptasia diaphana]|nr:hypothetical protein AC249_AIPGENE7742 [Exaiptasia diaphana]